MLPNDRRVFRKDGTPMTLLAIEDVPEERRAEEELQRLNADRFSTEEEGITAWPNRSAF
jgi:hypothetical protein